VLSKNDKVKQLFAARFDTQFRTVRDYYAVHGRAVQIEDASPWLSELAEDLIADPAENELAE
jgi:hypothetical protein